MNDTVNITRQELYSQGVEAYDNALLALEGDAEILQNMLTQGAIAAAAAGIEPPDEDCTAEDEFEYNWQLINFIKEQEQKRDRKSQKFVGFTRYAEDLGNNFTLVAGATAKPPNTNPIVKCKDKDSNGHYIADIVSLTGEVYKEHPTFNCQTWETFKPHDFQEPGGPYGLSEMRYIFLGLTAHAA